MTSGNFMLDIKHQASSYRLFALLPSYNRTAASQRSDSDVVFRRKEITHEGMRAVLQRLNDVLRKPFDFLCADKKYRTLMPMLQCLILETEKKGRSQREE